MTSRVEMIIETLRAFPEQKFTAKELAQLFLKRYPAEIAEKSKNPRYSSKAGLVKQLAAEIGGERTAQAKTKCPNIQTRDKPRPRLYYWGEPDVEQAGDEVEDADADVEITTGQQALNEQALYPLLMDYCKADLGLFSRRIDERKSSNNKGSGANHWLHPDVVAMEPLDQSWDEAVRTCVRHGNHRAVKLWSFEVKKALTRGNVRKCFFQAVSNSSWANLGYLVATELHDGVERELQMLCALHGIGVLLLDVEDLFNSQILIPAKEKPDIDWESANRIVAENSDFHDYIEQVGIYHQTGKMIKTAWNKHN